MTRWPVKEILFGQTESVWFDLIATYLYNWGLLRRATNLRRSNAELHLIKVKFRQHGINLLFHNNIWPNKDKVRFVLYAICFKTVEECTYWRMTALTLENPWKRINNL